MILLEPHELRAIIEGKTQYKKCPSCDGTGIDTWYEDMENGEIYATKVNDNCKATQGQCGVCDMVGYVPTIQG